MKKFDEAVEENLGILEQYIPIVARVHGGNHPEFHDVKRIFDEVNVKIKNVGRGRPDLDKAYQE